MSLWSRIWRRLDTESARQARESGKGVDPAQPHSGRGEATGGVPDPDAPDTHSSTGTTPSGTVVGRVGGDDPGALETGAEKRAAEQRPDDEDKQN